MRKEIFIGIADYQSFGMSPCALLPESDSPHVAGSIAGVAHQQVELLGENWRDKISFNLPTTETLRDGDNKYKLVKFTKQSIATFEEAMARALADRE